MIILFEDSDFQEECNNFKRSKKRQGEHRAKKIRQRLDDLRAATVLKDMKSLPGRCHELVGDHKGQLSLDVDHPHRLLFVPFDNPPSLKPDGGIDWTQVHVIKILGIEDTHD